jgi:hypothetical protein
VCLHHTLYSDRLSDSPNDVMLQMTVLNVVRVAYNEGHIFALFILEADLPAIEKLRSGLNVGQLRVLERSLELSTDNVFETVVRDHMVVRALILDRYSLLHQTALFELITVDE